MVGLGWWYDRGGRGGDWGLLGKKTGTGCGWGRRIRFLGRLQERGRRERKVGVTGKKRHN